MDIAKVVIPAAGWGIRFLPYTKSIPKEMLPLLNKPAIQYIIEEALESNLNNFSIIISRDKSSIINYFDSCPELELMLDEKNRSNLVAQLQKILRTANFTYVRQAQQLGLGHAISLVEHLIHKEYFAVMLPDDIIVSQEAAINQLVRVARQEKGSVIAVQEVPQSTISNYGVIGIKKQITPNLFQVSRLVEKPELKDSPSNLAVVGRYVLSPKIFDSLNNISENCEGELQLTDAIDNMMRAGEKVFAYKIPGMRYDIGTPIGWIKAVIGIALKDPEYGPHLTKLLSEIDSVDSFLYNQEKAIEHEV